MEERLKQRLVGAIVLVSLAVVFVPILFDVSHEANEEVSPTPMAEIRNVRRPARTVGEHHPRDAADAAPRRRGGTRTQPGRVCPRRFGGLGTRSRFNLFRYGRVHTGPRRLRAGGGRPAIQSALHAYRAGTGGRSIGWRIPEETGDGSARSGVGRLDGPARELPESENALALRKRLQARGYPAFVETGSTARGAVSRVFVGPIPAASRRRTLRRSCGGRWRSRAS